MGALREASRIMSACRGTGKATLGVPVDMDPRIALVLPLEPRSMAEDDLGSKLYLICDPFRGAEAPFFS